MERLPLAEKLGQTESAARTRANIGECYNRLGDYRSALGYFEGAMKAFGRTGEVCVRRWSLEKVDLRLTWEPLPLG